MNLRATASKEGGVVKAWHIAFENRLEFKKKKTLDYKRAAPPHSCDEIARQSSCDDRSTAVAVCCGGNHLHGLFFAHFDCTFFVHRF